MKRNKVLDASENLGQSVLQLAMFHAHYTNVFHCFILYILRTLRLSKLKTEGQTTEVENLTVKFQISNENNSCLFWVSLIGL